MSEKCYSTLTRNVHFYVNQNPQRTRHALNGKFKKKKQMEIERRDEAEGRERRETELLGLFDGNEQFTLLGFIVDFVL